MGWWVGGWVVGRVVGWVGGAERAMISGVGVGTAVGACSTDGYIHCGLVYIWVVGGGAMRIHIAPFCIRGVVPTQQQHIQITS